MKITATKTFNTFSATVKEVLEISFSLRQALESLLYIYTWDEDGDDVWEPAVNLQAERLGDVLDDIAARIARVRTEDDESGTINRLHPEVWAGVDDDGAPLFIYTTASGICRLAITEQEGAHWVYLEFSSHASRLEESSIGQALVKAGGWTITTTEGGEE